MPDNHTPNIITTPPNEPQPDHDEQLVENLSKLFGDNAQGESKVSEPKDSKPIQEVEKQAEPIQSEKGKPTEDLSDKNKVSQSDNSEKEEIKSPDFKHPKKGDKGAWDVMRESNRKAKEALEQKDQELTKLKASLAEKGQVTSQEAETLKKEIEELKSYRGMVDIQADPEFIQKFDEPISKRTDQIAKMLTEWGVAKEIIEKIDYTDPALLVRIEDTIAENKDKISAKKFLRLAEEVNELYDKRTESLDEYRKNYKDLLETKKKESFTKQAENEGRTQKRIQEISQLKDEKGETQFPFLNQIQAKDPANAAEVEQVNRHNKAVEFLKAKLDLALKAETPEDKADVAVAAVAAHWTNAQLRAAIKKIESLQTELGKISKVSNETPKSQRTKVNHNGDTELDLDVALNNFRTSL